MKPKAQTTKVKIGKLDYIKIKNFQKKKTKLKTSMHQKSQLTE